ncbi:sugar transferase [Limnohabitans sp. 2KL-1]|jgi:lipopolysaccharide/colanic/teichoic acid biosynthesis glycosyltransferase|uniref:sugar transferase n=1 Tax=Limnohabitans sp. 2KL-1 TaxID=1100699 RepID=UPI0018EE9184|nr:sugar transferase [Limnohabitans sp. 2KL-1]
MTTHMLPTLQTTDEIAKERSDVLWALENRLKGSGPQNIRYWRLLLKKYMWLAGLGVARALKRSLDILASLIGLILLSPILLVVMLAIWWHDKGPVIFVQKRVGQWGREFNCPKFRSMVLNAEALKVQLLSQNQHKDGITFKIKRDPRITPIGRFIRKTSIDELPQLWCVLVGDMSLVGPRPPVPQEVAKYSLNERRRLDVKPGLTCFWQVEGRGDVPFSQQVEMDIRYIDSQGVWLDMLLILKTIPAVLFGKGAY